MNGKKLIGMALVFVLLAGVAIWQKKSGTQARSTPSGKTLLDGIDLNAVTGLDVGMGSNSVALAKTDGRWRVASLYGYPADFKKLANAIRAVADVKLGKPVRTGNVDESELGFGKGIRRIVLKTGDAVATGIEVGARREASETAGWANQYFVRLAGKDPVYLLDYDFRPFSEKPEEWIERQILNVRSSDVVAVKCGDVNLKVDGADWKLADLDAGKEELQSPEANKMRSALQYLDCKSIADKSKTDAWLGFTNAVEYVARTKEGFTYTATFGGEINGDRYARFSVAYTKPAAPSAPAADAQKEVREAHRKQLDAFNATCAANTKKAADLNTKLAGWTYLISSGKAGAFLLGRDKLVKEKAAEEPLAKEQQQES